MAGDPCSGLLNKLRSLYIVDDLDTFWEWKPDLSEKRFFFTLRIRDKQSKEQIAQAYVSIDQTEKQIHLITLERYRYKNIRETYYKGLGQILLYILVCKSMQIGYAVSFRANESDNNRLIKYYKNLGFQQVGKSHIFKTMPTSAGFSPRIEESMSLIKNSSPIEYFKPVWISDSTAPGGFLIECPICHARVNPRYDFISHSQDCENLNKITDLSERPTSGGRRSRKHRKTRKASHKNRKEESKRFL